jgi:hypothetical protein
MPEHWASTSSTSPRLGSMPPIQHWRPTSWRRIDHRSAEHGQGFCQRHHSHSYDMKTRPRDDSDLLRLGVVLLCQNIAAPLQPNARRCWTKPPPIDPKSWMRRPHVRFCERCRGVILCTYSTRPRARRQTGVRPVGRVTFVVDRREIPDGRMATARVVEALDNSNSAIRASACV